MVSALVRLLNEHWWSHTGSCFKSSRSSSGDPVCRYSFPRRCVSATRFRNQGVELCRKPAHEYINGFNNVLMAAFKSNHDIQVLLGGRDMANRIYYCCKYVTKDQHQIDSVAAVALAAVRRRQEKELTQSNLLVEHAEKLCVSRKRVAPIAYNLSNRQEMAGPMASLYIQRGSCAYTSAKCENLHLYNILTELSGTNEFACDLVEINTPITDKQTPRVFRPVATLDDYTYRPEKQKLFPAKNYKIHI
ncbi:hypothetical protein PHMEG_00024892 [Phytophthora megakarya]|uniref:Uncharacterized protein n=1 Tax=Phytophthora megakarya TaxID=4795 RepID=A0A225VF18_9STRA|nr:hypothetical protein PHMEG_00024892 [Phytophthora megakarya]